MDVETYSEKDAKEYLRHVGYTNKGFDTWENEQKLIRHLSALQRHNVLKFIAVMDYLYTGNDPTVNRLFVWIAKTIYNYFEMGGTERIVFKNPKTQVKRVLYARLEDSKIVVLGSRRMTLGNLKRTVIKWMKDEGFQFYSGNNTYVSACIACSSGAMMAMCSGCNVSVYCGQECQKKDWDSHNCTKRV